MYILMCTFKTVHIFRMLNIIIIVGKSEIQVLFSSLVAKIDICVTFFKLGIIRTELINVCEHSRALAFKNMDK